MRTYKQVTSWAVAHGFKHIKRRKYQDSFVFENDHLYIMFYSHNHPNYLEHAKDPNHKYTYGLEIRFGNPKNPSYMISTGAFPDSKTRIKAHNLAEAIEAHIKARVHSERKYAMKKALKELNRATYYDNIRFGIRHGKKLEEVIVQKTG